MSRRLRKYYQAWELRQQGKKLHEIAEIMGFKSKENARRMIAWVNYKIKSKKIISKELKSLISKHL